MVTRVLSVGFAGALAIAAYAGCSAPPDTLGGGNYGSGSGGNGQGTGGGTGTGTGGGTGTGTGGGTPGTDGGSTATGMTAEDYYISTVDPSIRPTCASCHATGTDGAPVYLASTAQPSYTTITSGSVPGLLAAPANSQLLLHGAHTGPALLPGQVTIVTQWLNMEVAARGINPAPVETVQQALAEFGQCMSYSDFTDNSATGVSAADISKQQTVRDGPCQGCHNAGDGGFWASSGTINGTDEVQVMFQNSQQLPYIKKWVTGLVDANGNFTTLAPSNEIEDNSAIAAECTGPACHPKFQLSSQAQQAIDTFVMTTITKWQNKQCTTTATDAGADSAP